MRTNLLKALMLAVIFCSLDISKLQAQAAASSTTEPPSYVTVYKEEGFRGESEKFLIGQYGKLDGGWKDKIKSVTLVGSVRVTLFDKEQFDGRKVVAEQSLYKLPGEMRGETASLIVESFSCTYAVAYKDTMYHGDSRQFPVGEYPKMTDGWNNMQSMELCGQLTVTLFNKDNFEGESMTLDKDHIDLGKFKKKAKSMKIQAQ
jgi:hypothetical protein